LVERATALRDELRDDQEPGEVRGTYSESLHEAFLQAGFYSLLVPRRYGGLEIDLTTYYQVMIEVARGNPGAGWCLTLGSSHALMAGSFFDETAQDALFADRWFCAPHTGVGPGGSLTRTDDGYSVTGRWEYSSGIPYSNWFMGMTPEIVDGQPGAPLHFAIPRADVSVVDNWGGDLVLGMRSSGSNGVIIDDKTIPASYVVPADWHEGYDPAKPTPGVLLHGNPMYLGRATATYHTSIAAVVVGAAKAALDEYEQQLRTRNSPVPLWGPRIEDPHLVSIFGHAQALTESAEALLTTVTDRYTEYCQTWADGGEPFDNAKAVSLYAIAQQAGALACDAVELMFRTAGTSAAARGSRLARYFRDVSMYRGHQSSHREIWWERFAAVRLGLSESLVLWERS
jgi:3-hydroxy-9,10-secoandrosta-1,3,5(10)-triene-9,17-dione monooxygenase